jgi:hypothetical protein
VRNNNLPKIATHYFMEQQRGGSISAAAPSHK